MEPATGEFDTCAVCGRDLWAFGPPTKDGDAWICADCDAARNLDVIAEWYGMIGAYRGSEWSNRSCAGGACH